MFGRVSALVLLGWSLCVSLLRQLWPWRPAGMERFLEHYRSDRVTTTTRSESDVFLGVQRCIACGRCDTGEGERIVASDGAYAGVMSLVLSAARTTADLSYVARGLQLVPESRLAEKTRHCPTNVPILELAKLAERRSQSSESATPQLRTSASLGPVLKAAR